MTPKPDVSAERKQQIFAAAITCFGRKGYHQTTMDDIVAESGLSKGALYWYFKSKKELFLSLFNEFMAQFGKEWESIAAIQGTSATDKLRASLTLFRVGMGQMIPFFGVMMEAWALTRHDEDVESLMNEFYKPYVEIMVGIIEEGVASGEFQVESTQATSMLILILFDGITLAMAAGIWHHDWDEIIDAAEEMVLKGLGVTGEQGG
jgi:AcrR family transcriptional regulator